jgi:NhaP-type Na+/H+ or K+/H+ antiporter
VRVILLEIKKMYRGLTDKFHFFLGLVCGLLMNVMPLISIIIYLIFLLYQTLEEEEEIETVEDMVEFVMGIFLGIILFNCIVIKVSPIGR